MRNQGVPYAIVTEINFSAFSQFGSQVATELTLS